MTTSESSGELQMDISNVLDLADLEHVHPIKARFLSHLSDLASRKRQIEQSCYDDPVILLSLFTCPHTHIHHRRRSGRSWTSSR
jgi:hypothetical protein